MISPVYLCMDVMDTQISSSTVATAASDESNQIQFLFARLTNPMLIALILFEVDFLNDFCQTQNRSTERHNVGFSNV